MSSSKKIKIALGVIAFVFISAFVIKSVIYKPHTLIENESTSYEGQAAIFLETLKRDVEQWQNKIVVLSGTISSKDNNGVMLNHAIYCQFKDVEPLKALQQGQTITLKGRIIGYDDLLEELKLDKTIIINTKK